MCGGTNWTATLRFSPPGLSPRVRGNQCGDRTGPTLCRSIPACAGEPSTFPICPRWRAVYPRVCGGTDRAAYEELTVQGLSPRVRGNLRLRGCPRPNRGSIPACAGEPMYGDRYALLCRVYPRVCGGTAVHSYRTADGKGLSPRVRGNRIAGILAWALRSRRASNRNVTTSGVYPRVCGGTLAHIYLNLNAAGLSPRVRGNLPPRGALRPRGGLSPRVRGNPVQNAAPRVSLGSIPACAGEPAWPSSSAGSSWVYPRVCGGTKDRLSLSLISSGLSPRVRGNRSRLRRPLRRSRSIPACAGEPNAGTGQRRFGGVYPRVCGGTTASRSIRNRIMGLSPRVRGNLLELPTVSLPRGSIPACAGEPLSRHSTDSSSGVYPRVCGGTWSATVSMAYARGLSPRVRGNLKLSVALFTIFGSIPACAGEP